MYVRNLPLMKGIFEIFLLLTFDHFEFYKYSRFRKANARTENAMAKQNKLAAAAAAKQGPVLNVPFVTSAPQPALPASDMVTSTEDDNSSSGDDAESSDEILSTKSEDGEIDYVKMWEDEAVETNQGLPMVQEFDEERLMSEINFLSFDEDKKLFLPTDKDILEKLEVKTRKLTNRIRWK